MMQRAGFSLLELLLVVAIIGILAAVGLPLYSQQMMQTRRAQAKSLLFKVAIALEHYHLEENTYRGATLSKLQIKELDAYQLRMGELTDDNYLLVAEPVGQQAKRDELCGKLFLNAQGEKSVSGEGSVKHCW